MNYDLKKHVYFISYSKIPSNVAAAVYEGYVGLGFIVNHQTGVIEDISCTLLTKVARDFLRSIIVGYNIDENDVEPLIERIRLLFHGHSQKAICVIVRENYNKYNEWKEVSKKKLLDLVLEPCYSEKVIEAFDLSKMKKYPEKSVYMISYAKIPHNISIAFYKGHTGVGFVIDYTTDEIIDCCFTFITDEAKAYGKMLFMGCKLDNINILNEFYNRIDTLFNGPSKKALCVIVQANYSKYESWKKENIRNAALFTG
ncbi:MAG: DUF3870 domain-containing protein [Dethiosulfatibacter sp.]|nr:DUF3870 domain-containing protein [Dethiosulfatibacter sp.]